MADIQQKKYSDRELLSFAYKMLMTARRDQIENRRFNDPAKRWLMNNETFAAIQDRIFEIRESESVA